MRTQCAGLDLSARLLSALLGIFVFGIESKNNDGSDEVLINTWKKGPNNAGVFVFRYSSGTLTLGKPLTTFYRTF
jgi:hypothetical protein